MKKFLLTATLLASFAVPAFASDNITLSCNGTDNTPKNIAAHVDDLKVVMDVDAQTITVDGFAPAHYEEGSDFYSFKNKELTGEIQWDGHNEDGKVDLPNKPMTIHLPAGDIITLTCKVQ